MSEKEHNLLKQELAFYTDLLKKHEEKSSESATHLSQPAPKNVTRSVVIQGQSKTFSNISNASRQKVPNNPHKRTIFLNSNKYSSKSRVLSSPESAKTNQISVNNNSHVNVNNPTATSQKNFVNSSKPSSVQNKSEESEKLLKDIIFLTELIKNSNEKSVSKNENKNWVSNKGSNDVKSNFPKTSEAVFANNKSLYKKLDDEKSVSVVKNAFKFKNQKFTAANQYSKGPYSTAASSSKRGMIQYPNYLKINKANSREQANGSFPSAQGPLNKFKNPTHLASAKSSVLLKKEPSIADSFHEKTVLPKIHEDYSKLGTKPCSKNLLNHMKTSSNMKSRKLETKYKVVNRRNSVNIKKARKSEERSVLDESNASIDLLDNSQLERLEQKLLAFSAETSEVSKVQSLVTHTPTATKAYVKRTPKQKVVSSKYKIVNKSISHISSLHVLKKSSPARKLKLMPCLLKQQSNILGAHTPGPSKRQSPVTSTFSSRKTSKQKVLTTKYKIVNKSASRKCSLSVLKKSPARKLLSSKYKVINKNLVTPKKPIVLIKKPRSARKPCRRVIINKFSIVNKYPSVPHHSPKSSTVLVKRLYKSRSTLINKNDSSMSYQARMIKAKYFGGKRRASFQKQYLQPKGRLNVQSFSSSIASGKKRFSHYKCGPYLKNTRFTRKGKHVFNKNNFVKGISVRQRNKVLIIGGNRYSSSLSGRKIRKLPSKGQLSSRKTPRKLSFSGKVFLRSPVNSPRENSFPSLHIANRVLHRSISTALTASTKKVLSKVNRYCMFYNRFGRCNRGIKCTYIHDPSKIAVCTRFLRGTCKVEGCPFSHEVSPGKMAICSYFLVGACDKDNCPYRHEPLTPDAELCKAFVQGYCPKGRECKRAHILICPKFILGECEKGSSCAYPHPPQKAKKAVSKQADIAISTSDVKNENDGFLEKVARYFKTEGNSQMVSSDKSDCKMWVARSRKLEEQPAFIPLSSTLSAKSNIIE